jgi:lipoprotein-releasing system permease protein
VTDKRTDIAILRTLGASPRKVLGVFMTQGLVIGWLGVALGVVALLMTGLATIYPAIRAARTAPAEALRYE